MTTALIVINVYLLLGFLIWFYGTLRRVHDMAAGTYHENHPENIFGHSSLVISVYSTRLAHGC